MSNLLYKFIACSDVHGRMRQVNGQAVAPDPIRAYDTELAEPNGPIAVMCCGDIMVEDAGVYGKAQDQRELAYHVANINAESLMCAGNHSTFFHYGTGSRASNDAGRDAWVDLLGDAYTGYKGDPTVVTREIEGDIFIAISDVTNNGTWMTYTKETLDLVEEIIDGAVDEGRRVFVLSHYPYATTYIPSNGSVRKETGLNVNRFAPRISNGNGTIGAVIINEQYPSASNIDAAPSSTNNLWNVIKDKRVIWFTGHTHNFWETGHPDGIVLYSGQDRSGTYATLADANYHVSFPYIKVAEVNNGPFMVNLPSIRWNLQDALVEVYDDKVVIHERRYEDTQGNPYVDTHVASATATGEGIVVNGENLIPMSPVTDSNVRGTATPEDISSRDMPGRWNLLPDEIIHTAYIPGIGGGMPQTYTATFVADGVTVGTVQFQAGATSITEPPVPAKTGYTGSWEQYTLANTDITINAVYTPIGWIPTGYALNASGQAVMQGLTANGTVTYSGKNSRGTLLQFRKQA